MRFPRVPGGHVSCSNSAVKKNLRKGHTKATDRSRHSTPTQSHDSHRPWANDRHLTGRTLGWFACIGARVFDPQPSGAAGTLKTNGLWALGCHCHRRGLHSWSCQRRCLSCSHPRLNRHSSSPRCRQHLTASLSGSQRWIACRLRIGRSRNHSCD